MAKSVQSHLTKALENTPAESAQCREAMKDVVPKIEGIIAECKEKIAGTMQPAEDQIEKLCLDAGLAFKKTSMVGIAGSTHRTVREQVLTRSMHRRWL